MGAHPHHRTIILTPTIRAEARFPAATLSASRQPLLSSRPVPKWTRYGYWDELGIVFTPTRVL